MKSPENRAAKEQPGVHHRHCKWARGKLEGWNRRRTTTAVWLVMGVVRGVHATRCGKVLLRFRAAQRQRSSERFVRENIVLIRPSPPLLAQLRGWALANKEFGDRNRRLGIFAETKLG